MTHKILDLRGNVVGLVRINGQRIALSHGAFPYAVNMGLGRFKFHLAARGHTLEELNEATGIHRTSDLAAD